MFYHLIIYLMGLGHGFILSKNKETIKKDFDVLFNLFMEKTKLNRVEYSHINSYMDVINTKLDVLINKINPKEKVIVQDNIQMEETIDETVDETIDETIDETVDETVDETIDETFKDK